MKKPIHSQALVDRVLAAVRRLVASRAFFAVSLAFLGLQALLVATTGRFSMAFDEYYHLGLITEYSKHLLPFTVAQPDGAAVLGSVPTDTSYLYHYLMSFPYRLISGLTSDLQKQIIMLRIVSLVIMLVGFAAYRATFLCLGLSRAKSNTILFIVALMPVIPFLAGQISYDTLLFTASGITLYWLIRVIKDIQAGRLVLTNMLAAGSALALSSLIKYAFFPIALISIVFIGWEIWRSFANKKLKPKLVMKDWRWELSKWPAKLMVVLFLVSALFFGQRYLVNLVKYHTPVPSCGKVLGEERCRAYDPYGRNISYREAGFYKFVKTSDIAYYPVRWTAKMMRGLFFVVAPREAGYQSGNPLPVAKTSANLLAWLAVLVILFSIRRLWADATTRLLILIVIVYIGMLFARNFSEYIHLGVPVAINGRYIVHLLPVLAVLAVIGFSFQTKINRGQISKWAKIAVLLLVVLMLDGGGVLPYIIRSADEWMWPNMVETTRWLRSAMWQYVTKN